MAAPLRNLGIVCLGLLICLILTWVALRGHAVNRVLPERTHHPFLADFDPSRPYLVAFRGLEGFPENTLLGFDEALKIQPKAILWADIRPTGDNTLVVFHDLELSNLTDGKGWVGFTSAKDVLKLNAGFQFQGVDGKNPYVAHPVQIPTLAELLTHFPTQKIILNICDNRPGLQEKLIEVIDAHKAGGRLLIQSDQEGLLKDLREKKPEWLFGSSQIRATQLRMLAAIGLAPAAPLKGDVYVTQLTINGNDMLTPGMIEELHRRNLIIFAGPIRSEAELATVVADGVGGVISRNAKILSAADVKSAPPKTLPSGSVSAEQ